MDKPNSIHHMKNKSKGKRGMKRDSRVMKVVYISSPMKVKTSASKFRDLVQELTGRHSDVSRFMELNGAPDESQTVPDYVRGSWRSFTDDDCAPAVVPAPRESPVSSDSFLDPFDHHHVFTSQMDQQLSELMFSSSLFNDSSGLDVLASYDSL